MRLPGHEAAGPHVDSLQKPDGADEYEDCADDVQRDFHDAPLNLADWAPLEDFEGGGPRL